MSSFNINEKHISQIPALQLLVNMGYEFISPKEALKERQDKLSNVILENVLRKKLKSFNRINHKGGEYLFSEENIQSAIQKLKNIKYDGLLQTNEKIYDLLTLGTALEQTVEGDSRSFTLKYIDWRNPERNDFHVTAEFSVERSRSSETARPDIVLFVNGIPFCVIECKAPNIKIDEAVSQSIRNQSDEYIPKLFTYSQMVLGINKNFHKYATPGAGEKFWSVWKEKFSKEDTEIINEKINSELPEETERKICHALQIFKFPETGQRSVTNQDETLFSLCRPKRLLEISQKFTIFDGRDKKIARYQQYFVIKSTLSRIKEKNSDGIRKGGIIWHTQGSGKSLTMVMLTRNLALDDEVKDPRIVLVTDRDDLDKQLGNTFASCNLDPSRATSGRNLLELITEKKSGIITTLIHKFDKALNLKKVQDESSDIFVLVDESHRTQFGSLSARMKQMFPNACYIGFTGTPLLKKEKSSFAKFGGLIDPHYSINQAVEDGAVVPLLYEGRLVEIEQNKTAIDLWFERHTQGLTEKQKADLKRKYARAEMLNKAERVIYMRAFDICEHFRANWKGTGFKAQLVAPDKASAIKYDEFIKEIGDISCDVVISPPDQREGYEEVDKEPKEEVIKFWNRMMKRYGSEDEYTKQIINQFKNGDEPEILIVVSKLLTGFDAPKNIVLYLCKTLREHNLLQAIARVNRVHENKEFGYIVDYENILGELDKALTMYNEFEGFDETDIDGTITSINNEISKLPQIHSDLWDIFKTVKNNYDEESYERLLEDVSLRDKFYQRLTEYGKSLSNALSSEKFLMETDDRKLEMYKKDFRKFYLLREAVKIRYAESIDYRDYEPKIKKLLDTHIQANEVLQLNEPANIFDSSSFGLVKESQGVYTGSKSVASQADTIAFAAKKTTSEKMDEDPAFYQNLSKLIQDVIDDFRAGKISDLEYLKTAKELNRKVIGKIHDDIPEKLNGKEDSIAYFGSIKSVFDQNELIHAGNDIIADIAISISGIIDSNKKINFWDDEDAQNKVIDEIDDYLYDEVKNKRNIFLKTEIMDDIINKIMRITRSRDGK
ncbi:MAG TPA: HsdR family type I site-specific deoxyribonuclease [bacterium]|nr:HsdR family type I site-specific deoxyribonuclease [bacterium]HPY13688.1 HsdR family type I site-specific deoxyribonuclease [bacterium]HQM84093.1 HsdR family type I site-specific deoxyribonuclease [bacterium]